MTTRRSFRKDLGFAISASRNAGATLYRLPADLLVTDPGNRAVLAQAVTFQRAALVFVNIETLDQAVFHREDVANFVIKEQSAAEIAYDLVYANHRLPVRLL
jgi:hypothetical protein